MAWEISISSEGWTEIREQLEQPTRDDLIAAVADDKFEAVYASADSHHAERAAKAESGGRGASRQPVFGQPGPGPVDYI